MKKLIPLSLMCLLLIGVGTSQAQTEEQPYNFSVDIGSHSYNGDLGNELLEYSETDFQYGIGLGAYLSPAFDIVLKAKLMQLDRVNGPNDAVFAKRDSRFETDVLNLNTMLRWKVFASNSDLNPYLTAGVGANFLQFNSGIRNKDNENAIYFGVPFGAGFNFEISDNVMLNFEAIYNRTFEDGLDSWPVASGDMLPGADSRRTSDIDGVDHDDFLTTSVGISWNFGGPDRDSYEERLLRQSMENLEAAERSSNEASETLDQAQQLNDETLAALEELREAIDQMPEESEELMTEMVRIVNNVQFEFDKAEIIEPAYDELNSLAAIMQEYDGLRVDIAARADERGSESYNEELSMRRAEAVKSYLIDQGVSASKVSTSALGESDPLMSGNSQTAYAQNRSVQLTLSYNGN